MNCSIGDRVVAKGRSRTTYRGTVRYIGTLPNLESKGEFIGLELRAPHGTSDGKGLFKTKPKHALFLKREQIQEVIGGDSAASKYTGSAATSHYDHDAYMDEFDAGFEQLRLAQGGSKTSSSFRRGEESQQQQDASWKTAAVQDQTGRGNDDPFTLKPRKHINDAIKRQSSSSSSQINCGVSFSTSIVNKTQKLSSQWQTGPINPQGLLFDASDRNILCQSLLGNKCVVGSADHGLKEFDTKTGKQIRELYSKKNGHSEWVTCVSHLPDGRIVSGGMDSKLCLWGKGGSRSCIELSAHSGSISSVCTSASGGHVISTSYDKTVRVWNTQRGSELTALRGHTAPVLGLDWSTEGCGLLLTGDRSGMAAIWDLEYGSALQLKGHSGHVTALKWLNGGQTCVTGDQAGTMRLWDSRDNRHGCIQQYQSHPGGAINDFEVSSEQYLISTGADKKIQVLDFRSGGVDSRSSSSSNRNHDNEADFIYTWTSHRDFIYSLDINNNIVITGSGDGLMLFHSMKTGQLLYGLGANEGAVRCIDSTSKCVVASGDDGKALVFSF